MLELTLTQGSELKIGDDIRIVFRGGGVAGRVRLAVDAPKEKRIERVMGEVQPTGAGTAGKSTVVVKGTKKKE